MKITPTTFKSTEQINHTNTLNHSLCSLSLAVSVGGG